MLSPENYLGFTIQTDEDFLPFLFPNLRMLDKLLFGSFSQFA